MKTAYALLALVGAVLPLSALLPWMLTRGFAPRGFVEDLFANRVSAFFAIDVVISAIVVVVFAYTESRRGRLRRPWIPVLATLLIGVSCGLPLLLWAREDGSGRS